MVHYCEVTCSFDRVLRMATEDCQEARTRRHSSPMSSNCFWRATPIGHFTFTMFDLTLRLEGLATRDLTAGQEGRAVRTHQETGLARRSALADNLRAAGHGAGLVDRATRSRDGGHLRQALGGRPRARSRKDRVGGVAHCTGREAVPGEGARDRTDHERVAGHGDGPGRAPPAEVL